MKSNCSYKFTIKTHDINHTPNPKKKILRKKNISNVLKTKIEARPFNYCFIKSEIHPYKKRRGKK